MEEWHAWRRSARRASGTIPARVRIRPDAAAERPILEGRLCAASRPSGSSRSCWRRLSAVWTGPAALAQDDEDLEDAISELTEIVAELEDDVVDLSDEVETLREEVESLEEEVDDLEAAGASAPPGEEGVERILGLWVETASTASADCGSITCASRYDWPDLELRDDGTCHWGETPYEEGDYEVHERGGSKAFDVANFDVLLQGEGDLECLVSYESYYDTMNIYLSRCPGLFAEPSEGGEPQELTLGFISFAPGY